MRRGEIAVVVVVILVLAGYWWWREQKKEHERIWANASHCAKYKQGYFFTGIELDPMSATGVELARKNIKRVWPGQSEAEVIQLIGEPSAADIDSTKDNEFLGCVWEYQVSKDELYEVAFKYPGWTVRDIHMVDKRPAKKD